MGNGERGWSKEFEELDFNLGSHETPSLHCHQK